MRITGFHVYRIYLSYKTHFNSKAYSIDDYKFKLLNPSYETFLEIKGKGYYDALAERLKKESVVINLFIASFMSDSSLWIGDIVNDLSHYMDLKTVWEGKIANLSYTFKKECISLLERGMVFDKYVGKFLFKEFLAGNVSLENFIIFKKMFQFTLDKDINYDYTYGLKYEKYEKLLNIDLDKFKLILKEAIMNSRA